MDVKQRSRVLTLELRIGSVALAAALLLVGGAGCSKPTEKELKAAQAAQEAQTTGRLVVKSNRPDTALEITPIPATAESAALKGTDTPAAEHSLAGLPPGKYAVTARSTGWPDVREETSIDIGRTTELTIHFKSGSLRVDSVPAGATVKQGSLVLGRTPLAVPQLPPGECQLTLDYPGWPVLPFKTTITKNVETAETVRLPHGKLKVESFPAGAVILFGGRSIGQTPLVLERFFAGTHKLTLQTKDFPPMEVPVTVEDRGEAAVAPVLANGFPVLDPAALLRTVWFDPSSGALNRTSLAGFQSRNGIVKNLDRKKLFVDWLGRKFRFAGVVKGYNPETGEIGFGEQKGEPARYRVTVKLSAAARADKEFVAQLDKGGTAALYGVLAAVEEPEWPARHISIEFSAAEPLHGGLPPTPAPPPAAAATGN